MDDPRKAAGATASLKVLMVVTVPMRYAGITLSLIRYVRHMRRDGLQIDFAAINEPEPSLKADIEGLGCRLYVVDSRNRNPLRYIRKLARIVREGGYSIVHAHGNSCTLAVEMMAAKLGGAKVRIAHSRNTQCRFRRLNALLRPAFEHLYTHAFACGEAAGRWLFRSRPFVVITNGTDTEQYRFDAASRAEYRGRLGLHGKTAVGHVANFNRQKNHGFLIEAFTDAARRNPELELVLMGDGPLRGDIEAMVRERGLSDRVIFTGATPEVPGMLSAMDMMALPSLYEGMPNVVIEWQVSGLQALVADTVTPECRLTDLVRFLPLQAEVWSEAMASAEAAEDRAGLSAGAVDAIKAAGFDIRDNAERLRRLYFEYAGMGEGTP